MDADGDMELNLVDDTIPEAELRKVGCTERGRASRIGDIIRTPQVEDEAEAIRDDGLHIATPLTVEIRGCPLVPIILVQAHRAACMMRRTVGGLLGDAQLEKVVSSDLQNVPAHRIHDPRIRIGDLEILVIEQLQALNIGLVLQERLPRLTDGVIRLVVEIRIPSQDGDLHGAITITIETRPVTLGLIVVTHEAGGQIDDVDLLKLIRARGPIAGVEEGGVALPINEFQLLAWGEEACGHRESLHIRAAAVAEDISAENEDRAGFGRERDCTPILVRIEGKLGSVFLVVQGHSSGFGTNEVDNLHDSASVSLEELAKASVVRILRRILRLLVIGERKADKRRRPHHHLFAEQVQGVGLDDRGQGRQEEIALLQHGILWAIHLSGVHPCHFPPAALPKVALLDLLREALQLPVFTEVPHGRHCRGHVLRILANLQHAKALLKEAIEDLLTERALIHLGRNKDVEAVRRPTHARTAEILRHFDV
mmetsp:Transcript_39191/g.83491  ORF Transcript_39191/g.83491 Transcript_39191/m.83491 type:complete len:482 (+) Transcript_39191:1424-2869(+)